MMKASRYNFIYETENYISVCNIVSEEFIRFPEEKIDSVRRILNDPEVNWNDLELVSYMQEKGFIIDDDYDEEKTYLKMLDRYKGNSGHLDLTIMPTLQCNFRCIYCYESHEIIDMDLETEDAIVAYVKSEIRKYPGLSIEWFGGEPLCALERIESLSRKLIRICEENKKPYMANITSNGYLLSPEVFRRLRKIKVQHYQITVDGLPETHNFQKPFIDGSDTFETVILNLINIKNQYPKGMYDITIRTNFTQQMLSTAKPFAKYLSQYFADNPHFNLLWRLVGNFGGERINSIRNLLLKDLSVLNEARLFASKLGLPFKINRTCLGVAGTLCYASTRNSYIITPTGQLLKCTSFLDEPINNVGFLDDKGNMHLNENWEMWFQVEPCANKQCKNRPTCGGMICPMGSLKEGTCKCPWDDNSIIDEMKILSENSMTYECYRHRTELGKKSSNLEERNKHGDKL